MGRIRRMPKGPRIIDIDILLYGQIAKHSRGLSIPHPALSHRRFVLVPLVEIAPDFRDPVSGLTMKQLLHQCPDLSKVRRLQSFNSILRC
jgi:2-amino-4-hydroxy-6-hydroxymethyldihydropteridine diphosphokinase